MVRAWAVPLPLLLRLSTPPLMVIEPEAAAKGAPLVAVVLTVPPPWPPSRLPMSVAVPLAPITVRLGAPPMTKAVCAAEPFRAKVPAPVLSSVADVVVKPEMPSRVAPFSVNVLPAVTSMSPVTEPLATQPWKMKLRAVVIELTTWSAPPRNRRSAGPAIV